MKILIVEDDKKIAQAIQRGLRQHSYVSDVAFDGDSGLDMAQAGSYDLYILDIMLPGSHSGIDIVKILRSENVTTPILLLTAKDTVVDRAYGLNAGADDYLVKPFAFLELIARVRALLRRQKDSRLNRHRAGALSIDFDKQIALYNATEIQLSKKEFALLEHFMRNANRVISKSQLIDQVWDSDNTILENTVEAHVAALRRKIDIPFKVNFIQTKKGFGYIFEDQSDEAS